MKINVHWVQPTAPSPLGNPNGVGVILRDSGENKLWGAMGPLNDMDEMEATLWAAHAATIEAWKLGFHAIHIETVNHDLFDVITI